MSRETWERVQRLLDQRAENKTRKVKHEFSLTGLVHCGHCGCLLVGELKKGRYVYYHCTGNRGRCAEPYVREERLAGEFGRNVKIEDRSLQTPMSQQKLNRSHVRASLQEMSGKAVSQNVRGNGF